MSQTIQRAFALHLVQLAVLPLLVFTALAEGIPEPPFLLYGEVRNTVNGQNVRLTTGTLAWTFQPTPTGPAVVVVTPLTNLYDQFSFVLRVPCETQMGTLVASTNVLQIRTPTIVYNRSFVTLNGLPIYLKYPLQTLFSMSITNRGQIERVDLTVSREDQDSDGDGLPDWWENLHFPVGGADPNADPDRDGVRNLGRYKAGTDPNNPSSVFEFINIHRDPGGGIRVEWSSVTNRVYILQRSRNLTDDFVDIVTDILATPPVNSYQDGMGAGAYFYRLLLQEGSPSVADADGNGIADEWERLNFDRVRTDPMADPDRDGAANRAEFVAGTNPNDPGSVFKLVTIKATDTGRFVLEWSSVVNRSYSIFRSSDPQTGYQIIAEQIRATPPLNIFSVSVGQNSGPHFYRMQIE